MARAATCPMNTNTHRLGSHYVRGHVRKSVYVEWTEPLAFCRATASSLGQPKWHQADSITRLHARLRSWRHPPRRELDVPRNGLKASLDPCLVLIDCAGTVTVVADFRAAVDLLWLPDGASYVQLPKSCCCCRSLPSLSACSTSSADNQPS